MKPHENKNMPIRNDIAEALLLSRFERRGDRFTKGDILVEIKPLVVQVARKLPEPRRIRIGAQCFTETHVRITSCYYRNIIPFYGSVEAALRDMLPPDTLTLDRYEEKAAE